MAVNCNIKVPKLLKSVRYMLAAVNGLFLITGLLILFVGIAVLMQYSEYSELITQKFINLSRFTVATGVIILVGSILGFYGAISEQFYFIAGYVVLLIVVLVFEVAIVIVSFGLKDNAESEIRTTMLQTLQLYGSRLDVTKMWDDLQMGFECCGVVDRFDWISNQIPVSCCHIDYGTISPFECNTANAYPTGCASALGEWLGYNTNVIAISALVATCFQVLITVIGGWLAWRSKFEEVELES